jgi:hypothetical protein
MDGVSVCGVGIEAAKALVSESGYYLDFVACYDRPVSRTPPLGCPQM